MARASGSTRTPTGRNVNDWMGRVPSASGTGPKNLAKTAEQAVSQVRAGGRPGMKSAPTPTVSPARASGGVRPPAGAGSGIAKSTTPFASNPSRVNKAKTARPGRRPGGRLGKPRADFPPKI